MWGNKLYTSKADMQKTIDVMRNWMEMTENTSDLVPGLQKIERCVAVKLHHFLLHK